ncbi:hypothetical protein CSIM01_00308 [Colletotrichum simmondsii]|uniref:Uncharacterized protein n=1 Tax=Colletotrichum simmondsii TaxID=703756 RepID=A0A135SF25_9PEZI|nr:hypothetical protein CSIM01_00308 [Colletotrichum simmondsii]
MDLSLPRDVDEASQLSGSYFVVPSPATMFWDELESSWPWLPSLQDQPQTCYGEELPGSHFLGDWIQLPLPDLPCFGPVLSQDYPLKSQNGAYLEPPDHQSAAVPGVHGQKYFDRPSQDPDVKTFSEPSQSQWPKKPTHERNETSSIQEAFLCDGNANSKSTSGKMASLTANRASHRKRTRVQAESLGNKTSDNIDGEAATANNGGPLRDELHVEAESPPSKRLACPFYKFDRVTHLHCARFHLKRVKDVKQHLLRKHRFHCKGCHEGFKDKQKCKAHIDAQQCGGRAGTQSAGMDEGISEHQVNDLLQRMNSGPKGDEHSWYTIWDILFPGRSFPASPFLRTEVEEVISTVCDLWQKNGPKVMSSLKNDSSQTNLAAGMELPKTGPFSPWNSSTGEDLLLILGQLAKVSATQSETNEANLSRSRLFLSPTAIRSPPTPFMALSTVDDKERWQLGDTIVSSPVKIDDSNNVTPRSRRNTDKSRKLTKGTEN